MTPAPLHERIVDGLVLVLAVSGEVFVGLVVVKAAWQATAGNLVNLWRRRS